VTADASGNLASDDGALYREVARVKSGAAVAMALADPTLAAQEQFGMKLNWGGFDGANAVGLTTLGVLGKNLFGNGDRLTISAGAGWGQATVSSYTQSVAGGHAGLQLTW
jgi:trimeric autotransporter adhesin